MKIVTQVGIIFSICWISQIIEKLLPFSFPASVIGMILLFILLCVHILKVDHIREKSDFLLENMAFFFIPAGVSIINYFDVLKNWGGAADRDLRGEYGGDICSDGIQHEARAVSDAEKEKREGKRMMHELFMSPFFGIGLSIAAFWIGTWIRKKTGLVLCNPLVLAIVIVSGVLLIFKIPYEEYNEGGALINMFLAPATACLAVSIYTRAELLKKNWLPIVVGASCGSLASMGSVLLMCKLFGMDEAMTVSLIPKSVTTPIAVSVAEGHGGMVPITVVAVIFTGILGSIFAPTLIRLFRVNDPMIAGISIGACSHAVGTSKAIELGETEGAMSGLAIGVCGILTVLFSMILMH